MKTLNLLPYLFALILIGCASTTHYYAGSAPGGIGGTGLIDDHSGGIGGTGRTASEGIGGSGKVAKYSGDGSGIGGTGIVGTITAFGSIWVNDAHIHFDENTPITINQTPATSGDLQLGQVVAVNSLADGEAYQAQSIDIIHEVLGPIQKVDLETGTLEVLSQKVQFGDQTHFGSQLQSAQDVNNMLKAGAMVEVSGLRRSDGLIVASRIDIVEAPEQLQIIGKLSKNESGQWRLGEQVLILDELLLAEEQNKRVLLSGHLDNDLFIVESLGQDSIEAVLEEVSEIIYEGYYFEDEIGSMLNLGGFEFSINESIEFTEDYDLDEPFRVNAILSNDGDYDAHDLLVERDDEYIDLIHHEDQFEEDYHYEHEEEWQEEWQEKWHDEDWTSEDWHEDYDDWHDEEFEDEYYDEEELEHFEDEHEFEDDF